MFDACICDDTGEGAEASEAKLVKARKTWQCVECHETIEKGQQYERCNMLFDGGWHTYRTCEPCRRVRNSLFTCWAYGSVWEAIHQEYCYDPSSPEDDFCICPG